MAKRFCVSDGNVINTYGFRVLSDGLGFPPHVPAFEEHETTGDPIGHWNNFELKDGKWYADFNPNLKTQRGKEIWDMIEDGHLGQASIGIDLRTVVVDKSPAVMLKDQELPTFVKCIAPEISVVKFASNRNSVALFDGDKQTMLNLSANDPSVKEALSRVIPTELNLKTSMKKVTDLLKLSDGAAEEVIAAVVQKLLTENADLQNKVKNLSDAVALQRKGEIKALLDDAEKIGKLSAANRGDFEKLFAVDFESTKNALEKMNPTPKVNLADFTNGTNANQQKPSFNGKTWLELSEKEPSVLAKLKADNYELFKLMYKADMGVDWKE